MCEVRSAKFKMGCLLVPVPHRPFIRSPPFHPVSPFLSAPSVPPLPAPMVQLRGGQICRVSAPCWLTTHQFKLTSTSYIPQTSVPHTLSLIPASLISTSLIQRLPYNVPHIMSPIQRSLYSVPHTSITVPHTTSLITVPHINVPHISTRYKRGVVKTDRKSAYKEDCFRVENCSKDRDLSRLHAGSRVGGQKIGSISGCTQEGWIGGLG